mmetsp:Transcript_45951/g.51238  ORF Transcript_45951/g.51238 Transcript_45951/m.51238 type:complete len:747 (+) Transcript_45951:15-2255(+)
MIVCVVLIKHNIVAFKTTYNNNISFNQRRRQSRMMISTTTFLPVAFLAALLLVTTPLSVVHAATGYVSDACSELCSTEGNHDGVPFASVADLKATISVYDTGNAEDIAAAKDMYGQDINCWDISELTSLQFAFDKTSFNHPLDCWDTSRIQSMKSIFEGASVFNQDIGMWNVSGVSNLFFMFRDASAFNQDVNGWDTSNTKSMDGMFSYAAAFNQDVNAWDTSNVGSWSSMFQRAAKFNQNINGWDTSNAKDCRSMFSEATTFNQDINDWDTSNVEKFSEMFSEATEFNQDINGWNTSTGTNFQYMFRNAEAFNQNLCSWKPLPTPLTYDMFLNSGCEVVALDSENAVCQSCIRAIDKWELQAVGEDSIKGKPSGTVELGEGEESFTVTTFFETNENLFSTAEFDNTYTVEVYTGVDAEQDDCATGKLLVNEGTFIITKTVSNEEFPYNQKFKDIGGKLFPQFTEGIVGQAIVTLSDPLYASIFTIDNDNDDIDGTIEFCVRITITAANDRITSQIDSKKKIKINLTANIADFVQDVDIKQSDTKLFEKTVSKEVDVVSFVCNNKNEQIQDGRSFSLGQNFRVCVGPTKGGIESGYEVDGFNELSCGGVPLVINKVATDVLTTIESSNKNDKRAVQSVLTPDFANGESVDCEGTVSLSFTPVTPSTDTVPTPGVTRYLAPSIQLATFSGAEAEEESLGLFKMNVKMNVPVQMNSPSIESSASLPLAPSVAIIGFGSVLSFVVLLLM